MGLVNFFKTIFGPQSEPAAPESMPAESPKRSRRRVNGAGFRRGYEAAKVDRRVADGQCEGANDNF